MVTITKEEKSVFSGRWRLKARHRITGEEKVIEGNNLRVTVGKQLLGDMLIDVSGYDTGLTYQAIGTGTTAVAITDTQLTTESARKIITSRTRSGLVLTFSTFFTAAQATYNIKEAGIFGHSTASGTANSGILFSHWLVTFDNSGGLYDLTFDYVLTIN
jgi:hypothetical protein